MKKQSRWGKCSAVQTAKQLLCSLVFVAVCLNGLLARGDDLVTQYRKLGLPESADPMPVLYSPAAEQRALRYRKSLAAAVGWYNERLHTNVPITLVVADKGAWEKVEPPNSQNPPFFMPHSAWRTTGTGAIEGLIVLPARIEDFPGSAFMSPEPDLLAEAISFHEAGHIFAHVLGIGSANPFVAELIANFFMAGYIQAGHPEFRFMTLGPPAGFPPPKYTALADLDYLYDDVGAANFGWFQFKLNHLASLAMKGQDFPSMVEKLQSSFPAAATLPVPVDEILGRLEKISPGVTKGFADLVSPSILARVAPASCAVTKAAGVDSVLVVRNDGDAEITITTETGRSVQLPRGVSRRLHGKSGQTVTLPDQRCLVFGPDPGLAVLAKP